MLEEPKFTESGLPIVSKAVVEVFDRDYKQREAEGDESIIAFSQESAKRSIGEDSNLYMFFGMFAYTLEKPEAVPMLGGSIILYDLLRRQGELYVMEEILVPKPDQTTSGLPKIISEDSVGDIFREIQDRGKASTIILERFYQNLQANLARENPVLNEYFESDPDEDNTGRIFTLRGAHLAYELLRRESRSRI
jgi:hypothetical protein